MINILDFTIIHSRQNARPILASNTKDPNPQSILLYNLKLLPPPKIPPIGNILQVAQKPLKISLLLQFNNMLVFIIKLMIPKTCSIYFECVQTMHHLPTLFDC